MLKFSPANTFLLINLRYIEELLSLATEVHDLHLIQRRRSYNTYIIRHCG